MLYEMERTIVSSHRLTAEKHYEYSYDVNGTLNYKNCETWFDYIDEYIYTYSSSNYKEEIAIADNSYTITEYYLNDDESDYYVSYIRSYYFDDNAEQSGYCYISYDSDGTVSYGYGDKYDYEYDTPQDGYYNLIMSGLPLQTA